MKITRDRPFLLANLLIGLLLLARPVLAQGRETLGIASWSAPSGWTREAGRGAIAYNTINRGSGAWCILAVCATAKSRGSVGADFDADWADMLTRKHGAERPVEVRDGTGPGGAESKTGIGRFTYNGTPAVELMTTYRLGAYEFSVVVMTNDPTGFEPALDTFERSLRIAAPSAGSASAATPAPTKGRNDLIPTTFDNGWTSVAQADWVRASKGDITMLMHYPTADDNVYRSDSMEETKHFWNTLVAPRYSDLRDFKIGYNSGFEAARFATATVRDPRTGADVYLVLFKKKGTSWMEIIAPSKSAFVSALGIDLDAVGPYETEWQALTNLATYNRFGVAASDLVGTWTSDFSGLTQYVNANTGMSAGTDTHTSRETFAFGPGAAYRWELGVATGPVGAIRFQTVRSSGTFRVPSCWKVSFSDIEGKPRTRNAFFTAVRGGKILMLDGTAFGRKR